MSLREDIERTLNQAILSTLNTLSSTEDVEMASVRFQVIAEIAEGLGVEVDVPNRRKVLMMVYRNKITQAIVGQ